MKNKIVISIVVVLLGIIGSLGYLYNQQKSINEILTIDNNRYENELAFNDSINTVLNKSNAELDSALIVYIQENNKIKKEKKKIQDQLNSSIKLIEGMSIDSLASYIVSNYLGDTYKVLRVNDNTFAAFQEITVRDIAVRNESFNAQNKLIKTLNAEIGSKDTLLQIQAKTIEIKTTACDTLLANNFRLIGEAQDSRITIQDLTTEVDKQKGLKRIAYVVGGVLVVIIILL